ncbi:endothelin-converting enzyme 1 [Rhipicephalus sanguineus]|uniref:Uncharacterized protein n=1 Tax=Rhipicephalus sanguineus TaxID=34632 RepID=A0A9D4TCH8_RHISA|nr:endothelin-converting enzyme 1 [Rhipicephalus sanguineus]KAH7985226.1 hypothetical protein HPB52_024251 [Rhipicephalus sanguineus]
MAKEHAFQTRALNYCIFTTAVIAICAAANYPILRWIFTVHTKYCTTHACERLTRDIRTSMNRKQPPCQDFYEFTCGKWQHAHPGFLNQTEYTYNRVVAEVVRNLKRIDVPSSNQTAVQKAAAAFRSCLSMINSEAMNSEELVNFIASLDIMWPSGGTTGQLKALDVLVKLSLSFDMHFLFTVDTYIDYSETYSLRVSVPSHMLYANTHNYTSNEVKKQALNLLFANENLDAMLTVLTKFEQKIKKTMASVTAVRRFTDTLTFRDIGKYMPNQPGSDWVHAINKELPDIKAITKNTPVRVDDVAHLEAISELVYELEDQMLLSWFVGWNVFEVLALDASYQLGVVLAGTSDIFNEKHCFYAVRDNLHFALTTKDLLSFSEPSTRAAISNTASAVWRSYRHYIRANEWMDMSTKARAQEKARQMVLLDGYPRFVDNAESLNKFYTYIPDLTPDFMKTIIILRQAELNYLKSYLHLSAEKTNLQKWNYPLLSLDSLRFHNDLNKIVVPVAAAAEPLYLKYFPTSWKFGGLGTAIAEQMFHAFDVTGKDFDGFGGPLDWWSNNTRLANNKRSLCYLKDFVQWSEGAPGLSTVEQYRSLLASVEGVRQAFRAYALKTDANRKHLRTIDFLAPSQIFFLSYCFRWCSKDEPRSAMNAHMCNFPLAYSKHFTDVYGCQKGDRMYYRRKCK